MYHHNHTRLGSPADAHRALLSPGGRRSGRSTGGDDWRGWERPWLLCLQKLVTHAGTLWDHRDTLAQQVGCCNTAINLTSTPVRRKNFIFTPLDDTPSRCDNRPGPQRL